MSIMQSYVNIPRDEKKVNITELHPTPIYRLLKRNTNMRVADSATQELTQYLDDYATRVSKRAVRIAAENGRKTVTPDDIKAAVSAVTE